MSDNYRFTPSNPQFILTSTGHLKLVEDVEYISNHIPEGRLYEHPTTMSWVEYIPVPSGFQTDLLSIPWWIQWRLRKLNSGNLAALPHDYMLCYPEEFPYHTRRDIDKVFKEALYSLGVNRHEANLMYKGVRAKTEWEALKAKVGKFLRR